jgi:taurine transport system substrate-binding protein
MKENPGMLRTFIEVTHEANARYKAGKSNMKVMAKVKNVCDINENITENLLGRMICPVQRQIKQR